MKRWRRNKKKTKFIIEQFGTKDIRCADESKKIAVHMLERIENLQKKKQQKKMRKA